MLWVEPNTVSCIFDMFTAVETYALWLVLMCTITPYPHPSVAFLSPLEVIIHEQQFIRKGRLRWLSSHCHITLFEGPPDPTTLKMGD